MTTNTETSAPPSVTINDKKYLVEDLNDKSKLFLKRLGQEEVTKPMQQILQK